jgi:ABC-type transport system involved in multi-copper enzyme maturation permease subunit
MIASLRAENLKSRKRVANWVLFAILVGLVLLFGYVITYAVLKNPPRRLESPVPASVLIRETFPENLLADVMSWMTSIGAAIMIILGGLSTASEYGWLTVQTILIQKPGRTAVLAGKLLYLALLTILFTVVVLGTAALASFIVVKLDGASSSFPSGITLLKGFGAIVLQLAVWTAFGMVLGVAFRSTAAAIGGGLVYFFVVEAIIARLFADTDIVKEVLKLLPGINAGAVNAAFPLSFRNPALPAPVVSATHGTITLIVYLVVFTLLAFLIFRRRDVTGG